MQNVFVKISRHCGHFWIILALAILSSDQYGHSPGLLSSKLTR